MGRYITGDIEGRFWFGVQSSDAADRFGSTGYQPEVLEYYFEASEHLATVTAELDRIRESLGIFLPKLDQFFETHASYSDAELRQFIDSDTISQMLSEYADYQLGMKIRDCLIEKGSCEFTAEL